MSAIEDFDRAVHAAERAAVLAGAPPAEILATATRHLVALVCTLTIGADYDAVRKTLHAVLDMNLDAAAEKRAKMDAAVRGGRDE